MPNSTIRPAQSDSLDFSKAAALVAITLRMNLWSEDGAPVEGATVRVWVAREDKSIESRQVRLGLASGRMVQVLDGLQAGERVITKGSLFLDRAAAGS